MVDKLPRHTGQRILPERAKDDDNVASRHTQLWMSDCGMPMTAPQIIGHKADESFHFAIQDLRSQSYATPASCSSLYRTLSAANILPPRDGRHAHDEDSQALIVSIAATASSIVENASNPSPAGMNLLKPVSCVTTGFPAAKWHTCGH